VIDSKYVAWVRIFKKFANKKLMIHFLKIPKKVEGIKFLPITFVNMPKLTIQQYRDGGIKEQSI
jgi:hypothetical protein